MGESFYAIAPQYIQNRIQDNARKAGSIGASETYRNVAVSGQNMNYVATTEWTAATQDNASVKFVLMDGGGIDCLFGSSCPTSASTFKKLLGKTATAGVQDVICTRYPEPGAPPGSNASLKACLDSTMPTMQTTCEGSTSPRCHRVDLRPVWVAGDTADGLHPTQSGGDHVADLLWLEMVKGCLAQ
ncbi:MAG: SGNH/GDSL hydrolase family protein [Pseudomonadota bacterium]